MSKNRSRDTRAITPEANYYLGCDVAKVKIDVSLINASGQELLTDTITVRSTKEGALWRLRFLQVDRSILEIQLCCH